MSAETVQMTHGDLESGKRHSCSRCPLALAMQRHFYDQGITVDLAARFTSEGGLGFPGARATFRRGFVRGRSTWLTHEAYEFIRDWDRGEQVSPLTFQVRPPKGYVK